MARTQIWKDGLIPGTWVTTKGQVFHCGPNDINHFANRAKAMMQNGFRMPWCFEHQQDNDIDTTQLSSSDYLARWAKNTGGHINDVRVNSEGVLEFLMDIDESDIPTLEKIKFVSPDIRHNWRDRNGPEMDAHSPFWPGQSIAHVAVTPIPVQYPQKPFKFDTSSAMSLSAAAVDVSLSAAIFRLSAGPKGKAMPFPPKKDDTDDSADDSTLESDVTDTDVTDGTPPPLPAPGAGGSGGGMNDDARRIQTLSEIIKPLGIDVHVTSGMTLGDYVDHLHTAFKTHQATKGPDTDLSNPNTAPDNPNTMPQEPELPDNSAPIMMSAAQLDRLKKLETVVAQKSTKELTGRIGKLFQAGFIDDKIRAELANEVGTIKLSVADNGDVLPNTLTIKIEAYERQMSTGKPGPFVKPKATKQPAFNPNKPISSALALSAAADEIPEEAIINPRNDTGDRDAQMKIGEEMAAMAGFTPKK